MRRWRPLVTAQTIVVLVLVNCYVGMSRPAEVSAHIGGTHFHKGGTQIHFTVRNDSAFIQSYYALSNHYEKIPVLYWDYVDVNPEISVYDIADPNEICGGHIPHDYDGVHRYHSDVFYNAACNWPAGYIQATFCQELGHAWSQEHHNEQNSCMGFSYWQWNGFHITDHDALDFYQFYRYHQ
jgi:hypothetical protein